jgi:hypothetical protein
MATQDEIKELPNVDLTPILDEIKETQKEEAKEERVEKTDKPRNKYGQFTKKDGGLDEDGILKSYKEIQGFATKVSQENNQTKEELAQIKEQLELAKYQPPVYQQPQQYQQDPAQIDDNNPMKVFGIMRVAEVLEEEKDKNPAEFQNRYAYAQKVSVQYPQLSTSARGVKKLFELGDKLRTEELKQSAGKALESIFGEPLGEEEIARLRTLVKGEKAQVQTQSKNNMNAYMPDTSTHTRTGADQNQNPNFDLKIHESAKKGDVDGVIKSLFSKAMAE